MSNAKLQIYSAVLKQQKPFKAAAIHQVTLLSRSLIHYHLDNLVNEGYLERDGTYYLIVARNELLDKLTSVSDSNHSGLLDPKTDTRLLKPINSNRLVEDSVILRNAKIEGYREYQTKVNKELDGAIDALKALRRFHNAKTIHEFKALNWIEDNINAFWPRISEAMLEIGTTRADIEKRLTETMGDRTE